MILTSYPIVYYKTHGDPRHITFITHENDLIISLSKRVPLAAIQKFDNDYEIFLRVI